MPRRFTGWHMTGIMVLFFAVVIAVNTLMATFAVQTFSGTVVDNSYVASQQFNKWLAATRTQNRLGWSVKVGVDPMRRVRIVARAPVGAVVSAVAAHPIGRIADQRLVFDATGDGIFVARAALPPGRFKLRINVRAGSRTADFADEVTG